MVHAHGGDVRTVDDPARLPSARVTVPVRASESGVVGAIDSQELGLSAIVLGAGRTRADQPVDPGAGIVLEVGLGAPVERGQPLAVLHTARREHAEAVSARVRGRLPDSQKIAEKCRSGAFGARKGLRTLTEPAAGAKSPLPPSLDSNPGPGG